MSKGAKLEEGRLTDSGDVVGEGVVGIEGHTEIEGAGGRGDGVIVKGNGRVGDLGALLRCTYDEEFSFSRVEGEFVGGEPEVERVKDVGKSSKGRGVKRGGERDVKLGVISVKMEADVRRGKDSGKRGGV